MSKTFLEILDLKKSYEHTNGSITLFEKFKVSARKKANINRASLKLDNQLNK